MPMTFFIRLQFEFGVKMFAIPEPLMSVKIRIEMSTASFNQMPLDSNNKKTNFYG